MKLNFYIAIILILAASLHSNEKNSFYIVKKLKGEAKVRYGTKENWVKLSLGDILKPDDTILLLKNAYIEIESDKIFFKSNGNVIVNISDLRRLTKEELLLQLAFEELKSAPEIKKEKANTRSTGIYGKDLSSRETKIKTELNLSHLWVNGVKALFENGFYETASIRAKNLMAKFDELENNIELQTIIAVSLEKLELYGEAISEYNRITTISNDNDLNLKITRKIQELRAKLASIKE